MRENIILDLEGAPTAYRAFIAQRNGAIAADLSKILGVPFKEPVDGSDPKKSYVVPAVTLGAGHARRLGVEKIEDFYGTKVDEMFHVSKTSFHETLSRDQAPNHTPEFAQAVRPYVLPGFSGFNAQSILGGFRLYNNREYGLRLKFPNESDGNGQIPIRDIYHLDSILQRVDEVLLGKEGLVLEADLRDPVTVSAGFAILAGEYYSFLAMQKNDIVRENGDEARDRSRYRGADIMVVRGELDKLLRLPLTTDAQEAAILTIIGFYGAYKKHIAPVASRLSFDYLSGFGKNGMPLSGVTDITGRLGGTCPALLLSIDMLRKNPNISVVNSVVNLNYSPEIYIPQERDAKVYVDHPALRITARINDTF